LWHGLDGNLTPFQLWITSRPQAVLAFALLAVAAIAWAVTRKRPVYLLDFEVYKPPDRYEWKGFECNGDAPASKQDVLQPCMTSSKAFMTVCKHSFQHSASTKAFIILKRSACEWQARKSVY
jgi:hypothetical protein